jgi:translation elongation factor EF-Tu-like GTPase
MHKIPIIPISHTVCGGKHCTEVITNHLNAMMSATISNAQHSYDNLKRIEVNATTPLTLNGKRMNTIRSYESGNRTEEFVLKCRVCSHKNRFTINFTTGALFTDTGVLVLSEEAANTPSQKEIAPPSVMIEPKAGGHPLVYVKDELFTRWYPTGMHSPQ